MTDDADKLNARAEDAPPAGWYTNAEGGLQWWDGAAWGPVAPHQEPQASAHLAPGSITQTASPLAQSVAAAESVAYSPDIPKPSTAVGGWSILFALAAIALYFIGNVPPLLVIGPAALSLLLGIIGVTQARTRRIGTAVWGIALCCVVLILCATGPKPLQWDRFSGSGPSAAESSTQEAPAKPSVEQQRDAQMQAKGYEAFTPGQIWTKAADPGSFTCDSGTRCLWYSLVSVEGCPGGFYVKADVLNKRGTAIGWTNEITAGAQPGKALGIQLRTYLDGSTMRLTEIRCMS